MSSGSAVIPLDSCAPAAEDDAGSNLTDIENLSLTDDATKRSRNWCYTLNNYNDDDLKKLKSLKHVYHVIGKEVGESGTHHLQGYITFPFGKTFGAVTKDVPNAHWERAKGNSKQNMEYCTKDGNYEEFGKRPLTKTEQGKAGKAAEKKRWSDALENAKNGDFDDIDADILLRYYRAIKNIREDNYDPPDLARDVTGIWILGPTGVGKSHLARQCWPNLYDKCCNKWWDGYHDGQVALLDDFDTTHSCLGHHLKRWADKYPFRAEIKGGTVNLRPPAIVVTSQYVIEEIFPDRALRAALLRRFRIIRMENPEDRPLALQRIEEWALEAHVDLTRKC